MKRVPIFLVFLIACSKPGMLTTSTSKPEVTIQNHSLTEVSNALADWCIQNGFNIEKTTFFSLEGRRSRDSSSAWSNAGIGTHELVVFNYASVGTGVHVVGEFRTSSEWGSLEQRQWLQRELLTIGVRLSR